MKYERKQTQEAILPLLQNLSLLSDMKASEEKMRMEEELQPFLVGVVRKT